MGFVVFFFLVSRHASLRTAYTSPSACVPPTGAPRAPLTLFFVHRRSPYYGDKQFLCSNRVSQEVMDALERGLNEIGVCSVRIDGNTPQVRSGQVVSIVMLYCSAG